MLRRVGKWVVRIVLSVVVILAGYLGYASATAKRRITFPDAPFPKVGARADPDAIERGRYLVHGPAHCSQCHSADDREHPEKVVADVDLQGGLEFAMGPIASTWGANLTPDPETGIGRRTDAELARTIRTGVLHDGTLSVMMRFSAAQLSDDDLSAVIAYLRSRPPVPHAVPKGRFGLLGEALLPLMPFASRPVEGPRGVLAGPEPSLERGAYLAEHVALCTSCHSPFDMKTFTSLGPKAGGGSVEPSHGSDTDMEFAPPNLTADPDTGYTGRVDEDGFVARLRAGRVIKSSIMPWEGFSRMTELDARSIYRYLRSLPPVKSDTGPSYRKRGWKPGA